MTRRKEGDLHDSEHPTAGLLEHPGTVTGTAVPRELAPAQTDGSDGLLTDLTAADVNNDQVARRRAEHALIEHFLPVAARAAARYRGRGVERDDLQQIARTGLVKAVRRWRSDAAGAGFLSYALPVIHGEIRHYLRDHGTSIRIPRNLGSALPPGRICKQWSGHVTVAADGRGAGKDDAGTRPKPAPPAIRPKRAAVFDGWCATWPTFNGAAQRSLVQRAA